jgi:release factor glutamine methyltransferase
MFFKIYKLLIPIRNRLASSTFLIKILFNVQIPSEVNVDFDMTTLLIQHAVNKEIKSKCKVFEMGVGTGALISNSNAKRFNNMAFGADISERRVKQSKYISNLNNIKEEFIVSDLFNNVNDSYDYIIFNPPYVPSSIGEKLELNKYKQSSDDGLAWNGGLDGMEVITCFLDNVSNYLNINGRVLLGVQGLYISREQIDDSLKSKSLKLISIYKLPLLTSVVYVLEKK